LIRVDGSGCDVVANILGDTPFTVTPCFFLRRRECNVYVDDAAQPQAIVVVPHVSFADVYVFVRVPLGTAGVESLANFISQLEFQGGLFVPAELVQPIRVRRRIVLEAEGLCFTYPEVPRDFTVTRPELVRRLARQGKDCGPVALCGVFSLPELFFARGIADRGDSFWGFVQGASGEHGGFIGPYAKLL